MGDDQLAGPCTSDVGVANSVSALWKVGGVKDFSGVFNLLGKF